MLHAGGGFAICAEVGAVLRAGAGAKAEATGEAGEAHGGDGGRVCTQGSEAHAVFCALEVKFFFGFAVYANEGMVRFAAGGINRYDGIRKLNEDAKPDGGGCFI